MQTSNFSEMTITDLKNKLIEIDLLREAAEGSAEHHHIHDMEHELLRGYFGALLEIFDQLEFKDIGMDDKLSGILNDLRWNIDHYRVDQVVDSTDAIIQLATRRMMVKGIERIDFRPKTYIITGDVACFGNDPIYVRCSDKLIKKYISACKYGCSECRSYQEVDDMGLDDIDIFVTENGTVFSKEYTKL